MIYGVWRWFLVAVLVVCVQSAHCLDPHRSLNQYGRQMWQTDNGLPQNTVRAVVQTFDGYIWLGTDDGLVRFNGNEFTVFNTENTPQLGSNSIQTLVVDHQNRLWVVTTGGLTLYSGRIFQKVETGLPTTAVWFVHEDNKGRVWVATSGGLCLMGDSTHEPHCEPVVATQGLSVTREDKFAEAPDGSIWLADGDATVSLLGDHLERGSMLKTADGAEILVQRFDHAGRLLVGTHSGLQAQSHGALELIPIAGHPGHVEVNAILPAADGSTWLGTSAGLAHGTQIFSFLPANSTAVQSLFQDHGGAIWLGLDHGVARVTDGRIESFRAGDTLAGSTLLASFEDREGNLWLGTESDGLAMLHEQKFTTYTTAEGLSGNVVRSVLQDASGAIWIGTDDAGLNRKTADSFTVMTTRDGLSSNVILSMAAAANGDLWVGTPTGLNLIRGRVVKTFTTADGLADDFIRSLLVDAAGNVWIGTRHGLTQLHAGSGEMTTYTSLDGLGSDFIGVMVQSRDGGLWIGTSGGLTHLQNGKFKNFTVKDGLASDAVTAIHEDDSGTLWLGSNGGGLSRMHAGTIAPVKAANMPPTIFGILEDAEHRLWISSRSGIFRVARSDLEQHAGTAKVSAYDTTDGMKIRECSSGGHPAAVRMRDGTMAFATLRGVSMVDPEHLHENHVPPLVTIGTVLVNDVPQVSTGDLTLEPGRQRVEFQYAGLSFTAPQKVQYRYKLEGFDPQWIDAGTHRAAFFTNLQPGRYVFRVAAANNDGVWSESDATMSLHVRPFFYQTLWFYALLALLIIGLAYLIYARRVRRVEALYQGVMEERSRIAREIHDTLAQGIVSISLQLEVVSRLLGASTEAARAQLNETRALVRRSLDDARSSIWDLRSQDEEELPTRMGRSLKLLTSPSNASVNLKAKLKVTGTYRAISRAVEDELMRIMQEAVTNAVRHSGCAHIDVELAYDMKRLRLMIADDGHGFDANAAGPAGHFGLQGMRERAAKIRAQFQVQSVSQQGTQISVDLSLV